MQTRKKEIIDTYFKLMHEHLEDVKAGRSKVFGLNDISDKMCIQSTMAFKQYHQSCN